MNKSGVSSVLYSRYRWWRYIVNSTSESVPFFVTFTLGTIGVSYLAGSLVMYGLQPDKAAQAKRLEKVKAERPTEYKEALQMADMNKRMLQEYLNDVKNGKDGAWWDFAMKGRSIPHASSTEDLAKALRDR
eukprot:TRINITY_DN5020_c0_g1_i1.p3 TRINITY_DN5020_c0_g1~~TRINITY_DN5020_c0_g1_i1.p3  ORF type:complete len:131 (-),score=31.45 TRINITY_DN5020_c0_g1_i1:288-680(-)